MLRKFTQKMAICLNIFMVLQLAVFAFGPTGRAVAAEEDLAKAQSVSVVSGFDKTVTAGKNAPFTLNVNNTSVPGTYTQTYDKTWMEIETGLTTEIASVEAANVDRDFTYDSKSGIVILGSVTGDAIAKDQNYSEKLNFVFNTPGKYQFKIRIIDITKVTDFETYLGSEILATDIVDVNVAENIALSTTLPTTVKMGKDVPFTATLDNTYGGSHEVQASLTVKDAITTDVAKLTEGGSAVTLTEKDGDLVASFSGKIKNGDKIVYDLVMNFAVDKTFDYSLDLIDTDLAKSVATYTGSVVSDGTAPVVTVAPKNINDVTKDVVVTFTANEAITTPGLVSTNATFTQDTNVVVVPLVKKSGSVYTATIPANSLKAGDSKVTVTASFIDSVENKTEVTGTIKVDTVAPTAVTNLVVTLNTDGNAVLTWTNPTAGSYDGIKIIRDNNVIAELSDLNATTYTDTAVEKGKTYSYVVETFDLAMNATKTTPVTIVIPAPVVATNQVATVTTDTNLVQAPAQGEVKAETTENKDEKKKDENKNSLPVWGIILLVILAGVGGYLFFTEEKPAEAATKKQPVQINKKKSHPAKKHHKKKK